MALPPCVTVSCRSICPVRPRLSPAALARPCPSCPPGLAPHLIRILSLICSCVLTLGPNCTGGSFPLLASGGGGGSSHPAMRRVGLRALEAAELSAEPPSQPHGPGRHAGEPFCYLSWA